MAEKDALAAAVERAWAERDYSSLRELDVRLEDLGDRLEADLPKVVA